jgi:response regulator of citrate/malate metabolism
MNDNGTKILIVEDDPQVLALHKQFVSTMEGFEVVGTATGGSQAMTFLEENSVDCLLLDIFMPDFDGLELLKKMRERDVDADVIIISAANEGDKVKEALRLGAFSYLLKPFRYERLRSMLCALKEHQSEIRGKRVVASQEEIDRAFESSSKRADTRLSYPKGIQENTLNLIKSALESMGVPSSAGEIAESAGISRVTVQRYIDFLKRTGRILEEVEYQKTGRPLKRFSLI